MNEIELVAVEDSPETTGELYRLLAEYGHFMYHDLKLSAGRQTFFKQLHELPGEDYRPPGGTFILAKFEGMPAGCTGLRKLTSDTCEIKRMYVRPVFRRKGIARMLCHYSISWALRAGYKKIRLDTNEEMREAVLLYGSVGFKETAPYCSNENEHPLFMEYVLPVSE